MNRSRRLACWQGSPSRCCSSAMPGYYLCRSDFSVSLPLIIDELAAHGMTPDQAKIRLGHDHLVRRAGLCDRQVFSGRHGRFSGRQAEFSDRHGRLDSVHAAVFAGRRIAHLHAGVDRQPPGAIHRLGGHGEDHFALVLVFLVWRGHGRHQPELSVRRRRGAPVHGLPDRPRVRLARGLSSGGGHACSSSSSRICCC